MPAASASITMLTAGLPYWSIPEKYMTAHDPSDPEITFERHFSLLESIFAIATIVALTVM